MPSDTPPKDQTLLGHRPFLLFFLGRGFSKFASQMGAVAIGWQVYELTNSAFYLGLVGLVQFAPMMFLVFVSGHVADRYDRQRVLQVCQVIEGLTAAYLAWGTFGGWLTVTELLTCVAIFGMATSFENPATTALLPGVAPEGMLQRATALTMSAFQIATISGPALGGLAYAITPSAPYLTMAAFWLIASIINGAIRLGRPIKARPTPTLASVFAGFGFVRRNPSILGVISLDLFAVLLGSATALLPNFARDILETGPWGLGLLRGAPAVGALIMAAVLSRHPFKHHIGTRMFQAIFIYGAATALFAISPWLWLSVPALVIMGAADTVSMVIRNTLVQLSTPDDMRGRVSAVNFLFVNASNQLGEFRAGSAAAVIGAVQAVAIGGVAAIGVGLIWLKIFPGLRHIDKIE
jgi:MFS family permease